MAFAGIPSRRRNVASLSAPYFVRVKISVWPAGLAWRMRASTSRFRTLSAATITCSIPSAGWARRPISTEACPAGAGRARGSSSGARSGLSGGAAQGRDNEAPKRARSAAARKPLENRQDERRRLAGAGLGGTDQIATGKRQRDGFLLNGGGALVAFFGYGADQL